MTAPVTPVSPVSPATPTAGSGDSSGNAAPFASALDSALTTGREPVQGGTRDGEGRGRDRDRLPGHEAGADGDLRTGRGRPGWAVGRGRPQDTDGPDHDDAGASPPGPDAVGGIPALVWSLLQTAAAMAPGSSTPGGAAPAVPGTGAVDAVSAAAGLPVLAGMPGASPPDVGTATTLPGAGDPGSSLPQTGPAVPPTDAAIAGDPLAAAPAPAVARGPATVSGTAPALDRTTGGDVVVPQAVVPPGGAPGAPGVVLAGQPAAVVGATAPAAAPAPQPASQPASQPADSPSAAGGTPPAVPDAGLPVGRPAGQGSADAEGSGSGSSGTADPARPAAGTGPSDPTGAVLAAPAPAPVTAPAPVAAPAQPAPAAPVATQLVPHVAALGRGPDGTHSVTLVLHPENLGPVQVQVTVSQGTLDLSLRGAHEQGRSALMEALPELRRELQSAGLECSRLDVDVDTGGAWTAQHSAAGDGQGQPPWARSAASDVPRRPWAQDSTPDRRTPRIHQASTSTGVDVLV